MSHKNNTTKLKRKVGVKLSEKIGKKIKALRKTKHLTQDELAEKLNMKRATISNWEIGRRTPHLTELQKIAEFLGVDLNYFGVGSSEIHDLIARAKVIFEDKEVPTSEKAKVYKEIMRLYLEMDEN